MRPELELHVRAYGDPARGDDTPAFRLTTKGRETFILARDGAIIRHGSNGQDRPDYDMHKWHVLGFGTRANSRRIVTLDEAADGAETGQGWVHDLDHGTHRMWGSPSDRRLASITRIEEVQA